MRLPEPKTKRIKEIRHIHRNNLGIILKARKIEQKEFAAQLGVNAAMVSYWVNNDNQPGAINSLKICKLLDISANELSYVALDKIAKENNIQI